MEQAGSTSTQAHYYVPQPMAWPIMASAAIFCLIVGGIFVMNEASGGWVGMALGAILSRMQGRRTGPQRLRL